MLSWSNTTDDRRRMTEDRDQLINHSFNLFNRDKMEYKFEKLDVWKISLDLSDHIYALADNLPDSEKYNLRSQIIRAVTSISLNIAEGSTSQTDKEQSRFIGYAIRSLIEVIACLRIMERRRYLNELSVKIETEQVAHKLFIKLQAFRSALN